MTALSYKPWLAPKLLDRSKPHTIRAERKQPIRPGQLLQHFTGMRTAACRRLGESLCLHVWPIRIEPSYDDAAIHLPDDALAVLHSHYRLNRHLIPDDIFRADGFTSMRDFAAFFEPAVDIFGQFRGHMIFWGDTFEPIAAERAPVTALPILRNTLGMTIGFEPAPREQWGTKNGFIVDKAHISPDMAALIAGGFVRLGALRSGTCRIYHATIAGMRAAMLPQALIPAALELGRRA